MNKVILALSIGDGHLSKDGTLSIRHCEAQKEYLYFKASLLHCTDRILEKDNNGFVSYQFNKGVYNSHYNGKEVRRKLYGVMNHKYFSKTVVSELDKFCIAVLYCDDGSLIPKRRNGRIHAYNLTISLYSSYQECERVSNKIQELFDVDFHIARDKGRYLLRCGTKEARKFIPQIKELIPKLKCFNQTKLKFPI